LKNNEFVNGFKIMLFSEGKLRTSKEKELAFKNCFFRLLKKTVWINNKKKMRVRLSDFKKAASIEAKFYSALFGDVKAMEKILDFYSDGKFKTIHKENFFRLVMGFGRASSLFYTTVENLKKNNLGKNCSHDILEGYLQWSFLWMTEEFVPVSDFENKKIKTFNELSKALMGKGYEKNVCGNLVLALDQLSKLVEVYDKNFVMFLKATRLPVAHQKFRELNWAMHSLVGYLSRWCPVFQYIVEDKRF